MVYLIASRTTGESIGLIRVRSRVRGVWHTSTTSGNSAPAGGTVRSAGKQQGHLSSIECNGRARPGQASDATWQEEWDIPWRGASPTLCGHRWRSGSIPRDTCSPGQAADPYSPAWPCGTLGGCLPSAAKAYDDLRTWRPVGVVAANHAASGGKRERPGVRVSTSFWCGRIFPRRHSAGRMDHIPPGVPAGEPSALIAAHRCSFASAAVADPAVAARAVEFESGPINMRLCQPSRSTAVARTPFEKHPSSPGSPGCAHPAHTRNLPARRLAALLARRKPVPC